MATNMLDKILKTVADADPLREHDDRYRPWVREIAEIDPREGTGYAFRGKSYTPGAEVDVRAGIHLVLTINTKVKPYPVIHFSLVKVDRDRNIMILPAYTTDDDHFWVDKVKAAAIAEGVPVAK